MSKVILSMDGGGIRGAATTRFLSQVEVKLGEDYGKDIRQCVDYYAGTSTGSIIALALATTHLTMDQIDQLYNFENAQKIFTENKGLFEIDGVNAPKYEAKGKTELLQANFGDATLGDVEPGKHVLAVAYAVEKRTPVVIKSSKNPDLLSSRVADASSAAPTYFPTREVDIPAGSEEEFWLIDGGVVANNPTMCAISEARRIWNEVSLDEVRVLSVGTGFMTKKINGPKSRKWGALQWMTEGHILDILSDERVVAYQAMSILDPGKYIRVNAELRRQPGLPHPPDDAMDDVSKTNIKRLRALGDFWFREYGEQTVKFLVGKYDGPSLDRIDPEDGKPIVQPPPSQSQA